MGELVKCKFCKESIVNGDFIDVRRPPIFDDIYHEDCYLITKKQEGEQDG